MPKYTVGVTYIFEHIEANDEEHAFAIIANWTESIESPMDGGGYVEPYIDEPEEEKTIFPKTLE